MADGGGVGVEAAVRGDGGAHLGRGTAEGGGGVSVVHLHHLLVVGLAPRDVFASKTTDTHFCVL